jgi:hypothetical protein
VVHVVGVKVGVSLHHSLCSWGRWALWDELWLLAIGIVDVDGESSFRRFSVILDAPLEDVSDDDDCDEPCGNTLSTVLLDIWHACRQRRQADTWS